MVEIANGYTIPDENMGVHLQMHWDLLCNQLWTKSDQSNKINWADRLLAILDDCIGDATATMTTADGTFALEGVGNDSVARYQKMRINKHISLVIATLIINGAQNIANGTHQNFVSVPNGYEPASAGWTRRYFMNLRCTGNTTAQGQAEFWNDGTQLTWNCKTYDNPTSLAGTLAYWHVN